MRNEVEMDKEELEKCYKEAYNPMTKIKPVIERMLKTMEEAGLTYNEARTACNVIKYEMQDEIAEQLNEPFHTKTE